MSRRFRPGLDYTVAHAGTLADSLLGTEDGSGGLDGKTILDATFCIVDERDIEIGVQKYEHVRDRRKEREEGVGGVSDDEVSRARVGLG